MDKQKILDIVGTEYLAFERLFDYASETIIKKMDKLSIDVSGFEFNDLDNVKKNEKLLFSSIIENYKIVLSNVIDLRNIEQESRCLQESQIMFLHRNLEITLKKVIQESYPDVKIKSFFNWNNLVEFFNSKRIRLNDLEGYKEFNELRTVCNNLKHNEEVSDEVKRIEEFLNCEEFNFENLSSFYLRIRDYSYRFISEVGNKIVSDLFDFDDARLERIAKDYKNRMNKTDLLKLSELLKNND